MRWYLSVLSLELLFARPAISDIGLFFSLCYCLQDLGLSDICLFFPLCYYLQVLKYLILVLFFSLCYYLQVLKSLIFVRSFPCSTICRSWNFLYLSFLSPATVCRTWACLIFVCSFSFVCRIWACLVSAFLCSTLKILAWRNSSGKQGCSTALIQYRLKHIIDHYGKNWSFSVSLSLLNFYATDSLQRNQFPCWVIQRFLVGQAGLT